MAAIGQRPLQKPIRIRGFSDAQGWAPNDPVFYLNHCNVDRFWRAWQVQTGQQYRPQAGDNPPPDQSGNDPMFSPFTGPISPNQVENLDALYTYDSLAVV